MKSIATPAHSFCRHRHQSSDVDPKRQAPRVAHRRRSSQRGAALVEGAIVMPVMIMFYGLMIFCYKRYDLKETLMAESRHVAFRGALHACQDGRSASGRAVMALDQVPFYLNSESPEAARRILNDVRLDSFISERGMKTTAKTRGTATNAPLSNAVQTRNLESSSQVYCVPREVDDVLSPRENLSSLARREGRAIVQSTMGDLLRSLFDLLRL